MNLINKKAFTLAESITVILVIASVAAMALPRMTAAIYRVRAEEGMEILYSLYKAQKEYRVDNGEYADSYQDDLHDKYVTVSLSGSDNFKDFHIYEGDNNGDNKICSSTGHILASIDETDDNYHLYITTDGEMICTTSGGSCPNAFCKKMGFD